MGTPMRVDAYIPDSEFDLLMDSLGSVPHVVSSIDHHEGIWLDHPIGSIVMTNQRFTDEDGLGLFVKGVYVMPARARNSNRPE